MRSRWWLWIALLSFQTVLAQEFGFEHQGKKRAYMVHLPKGYHTGRHYPLVISIHGWGGNPEQQEKYTLLSQVADKYGFIVAYPKIYHRYWNVGMLPTSSYTKGKDDVGFIRRMLDSLEQKFSVDRDSVYAVGTSLGGFLCQRLACEMGDRLAAFASVSGLMTDSTKNHCPDNGNMPVLLMHGTKDPSVWYKGNRIFMGADNTINYWRAFNGCSKADTIPIPDNCKKDKSTAQLIKFTGAKSAQVWFIKIKGGGHNWPGAAFKYWYFGPTNYDFSGGKMVWDFFRQFSLSSRRPMYSQRAASF